MVYYDSFQRMRNSLSNATTVLDNLWQYLLDEKRDKGSTSITLDRAEWTFDLKPNIPQQNNGDDCGVFVCAFAKCLSLDLPFNFSFRDISNFRKHILYRITLGSIN